MGIRVSTLKKKDMYEILTYLLNYKQNGELPEKYIFEEVWLTYLS